MSHPTGAFPILSRFKVAVACVLLAVPLILSSCDTGQTRDTAGNSTLDIETADSAGQDSLGTRFQVTRQILAVIGDAEGAGQVYDRARLTVARDGRVFLTAPQLEGIIKVFDQDGRYIDSFGGTGDGPGEFRTPSAIIESRSGELTVLDRRLPRNPYI